MSRRLLALDGLRGLLALYILAGHTVPFLDLPATLTGLGAVLSHGRAAVVLFFILSGLVILDSLGRITHPRPSAAQFLKARAGRLLPVYALALILAAAALALGNPFPAMAWLPAGSPAHAILEADWPSGWVWHLTAHALLLHGMLPAAVLPGAAYAILGPAWSLSTEWQFYALIALILALGGRRIATPTTSCMIVTTLLLLGLAGLGNDLLPPAWRFDRAFLPQEAGYFALGVASQALLKRSPGDHGTRIVFALALALACTTGWTGPNPASALIPLTWLLCLGCQAPSLAPSIARAGLHLGYRLLTRPFLLWAGRISYPLYLTHMPVQRLLMLWLAPHADGHWSRFTLSYAGPAIALPLLVALILHRTIEAPWRRSHIGAQPAPTLNPPLCASASNTSAAGLP